MSKNARSILNSGNPLIDRQEMLDTAASALQGDVPVVTITGPGGVGKTRLAVELSTTLAPSFSDGVVLVDLASIDDPADLDVELARELGIRAVDRVELHQRIDAWIAASEVLVVLDNAEHVLGIRDRVVEWMRRNPNLRVIVTSRHALNISWEQELVLTPLRTSLDQEGHGSRLSPAACLYLAAAGERDKGDLSADARDAVEELCSRLDGLPLAIELIAARLRTTDPDTIRQLLAGGGLGGGVVVAEVDSALEQAFSWSYWLLSPGAQRMLRYLAVFVDGFTVSLVEAQMSHADAGVRQPPVLDCLDELIDHHLLVHARHSKPEQPVFRMLGLIRRAALGRLIDAGEEEDAREAHAQAMTEFAQARSVSGQRPSREYEVGELMANFHNLARALEWFRDRDDDAALRRLVAALWWLWYAYGFYGIGLGWVDDVRARSGPDEASPEWGVILISRAMLLSLQGESQQAREGFEEAWVVAEHHATYIQKATLCVLQAVTLAHLHDFDLALERLRQALGCALRVDDHEVQVVIEGTAWLATGITLHEGGQLEQAEQSIRTALDVLEGSGYHWGLGRAWCDLADVLRDRGRHAEAIRGYQRALVEADAIADRRILAATLSGLATVLSERGHIHQSAWAWGAAKAQTEAADDHASFFGVKIRAFQRSKSVAKRRLGVAEFERLRAEGASTPLSEVLVRVQTIDATEHGALQISEEVGRTLTAREREVLALLVEGRSTRSIAGALGITERTVSAHIGSLFRKLNVTSRLELISVTMASRV